MYHLLEFINTAGRCRSGACVYDASGVFAPGRRFCALARAYYALRILFRRKRFRIIVRIYYSSTTLPWARRFCLKARVYLTPHVWRFG